MKINVMGVNFDNITMEQALARAEEFIARPGADYCVTPNAEIVFEAMHDEEFSGLINHAAMVLPDGAGVVLAAKILKTPLKQKVAGIDFAANLLGILAQHHKKLYLLGSKPGVAEQAAENMKQKHPDLQICGMADGYFKDEAPVVEKINDSGADVLFVCLGAPKQERFMLEHQKELKVSFMIGLGGSLDGFAGNVRRAPQWMIKMQLEWLYRLIKEPRRLGRMMRLPKFLLAVYKQKLFGGKHG